MSKTVCMTSATAEPSGTADKSNLLRSTALECLHAAKETKYRAIRAELRQLADAYMNRALTTETPIAAK